MAQPCAKPHLNMASPKSRTLLGLSQRTDERGLLLLIAAAAIVSALLLLWLVGNLVLAAGFMASVLALGALIFAGARMMPRQSAQPIEFDWSLVREASDNDEVGIAVTDRAGRLVCVATRQPAAGLGGPGRGVSHRQPGSCE